MEKNKIQRAQKHIFVRDVFKQWYVKGINKKLNSTEKLLNFLQEHTKNKKIITIGSSAGAYAAVLYGALLNAKIVFALAPQFNLNTHVSKYDRFINNADMETKKYFNLLPYIKKSQANIFYFYGVKSKNDLKQSKYVKNCRNIFHFKFNIDVHGPPMYIFDLTKLINLDKKELLKLFLANKKKMINRSLFSIQLNGLLKFLQYYFIIIKKFIYKKIINKE